VTILKQVSVTTLLQIGLFIHKDSNCEGEKACRDQSQMTFHETVNARSKIVQIVREAESSPWFQL
jgi:hypothetical protein